MVGNNIKLSFLVWHMKHHAVWPSAYPQSHQLSYPSTLDPLNLSLILEVTDAVIAQWLCIWFSLHVKTHVFSCPKNTISLSLQHTKVHSISQPTIKNFFLLSLSPTCTELPFPSTTPQPGSLSQRLWNAWSIGMTPNTTSLTTKETFYSEKWCGRELMIPGYISYAPSRSYQCDRALEWPADVQLKHPPEATSYEAGPPFSKKHQVKICFMSTHSN